MDYYKGNPEALLAERKGKLKAAAAWRKEVNIPNEFITTDSSLRYLCKADLHENETKVLHQI